MQHKRRNIKTGSAFFLISKKIIFYTLINEFIKKISP